MERQFGCRCSRLRAGFLILVVTAVLFLYYVNLEDVSKIWSETVQLINNSTERAASVPSNTSTSAFDQQWISAFIPRTKISVTPFVLPGEQCKPETTYTVAYPCTYHYILNESERCQNDKPFLVLMVPVEPNNRGARDAIRATWGSERMVKDKVVSIFFMLGQSGFKGKEALQQKILQESEEHHDIIQSDFLDSYKNLTIKTMVIMEWLAAYCQNTGYAMKIDSDMFLNVNTLVGMLLTAPRENYMTGLVAKGATVLRNPNSKWYLPKNEFPEDFYPPYALGLGYVFSIDLANKLIEGAKQLKAVYIEDVFLGLCMRHLEIPFTSQNDQSLFNVFPVPYDRCRYSRLIATTTRNREEQINSWKDLKRPGTPC